MNDGIYSQDAHSISISNLQSKFEKYLKNNVRQHAGLTSNRGINQQLEDQIKYYRGEKRHQIAEIVRKTLNYNKPIENLSVAQQLVDVEKKNGFPELNETPVKETSQMYSISYPQQRSYFILNNGVKVDMVNRGKVRNKSVSNSIDIFGVNQQITGVDLTIRPSLKKKFNLQEQDASLFNKSVSDSRSYIRNYNPSSPKFTKTPSEVTVQSRAVTRDQRLQNFAQRSSSNRSSHIFSNKVEQSEDNKQSKSLLKKQLRFEQDINADDSNADKQQVSNQSSIPTLRSEVQIRKIAKPQDFEVELSKQSNYSLSSRPDSRSLIRLKTNKVLPKLQTSSHPKGNFSYSNQAEEQLSSMDMLEKKIHYMVNMKMKNQGDYKVDSVTGFVN